LAFSAGEQTGAAPVPFLQSTPKESLFLSQPINQHFSDRIVKTFHVRERIFQHPHLAIQFLSQREAIDTDGPLGRAIVVIVSAVAELERSLIVERVRAGMRRAKLDGRRIGRTPLDVDRGEIVRDRLARLSLTAAGKKHKVSRATVCRLVNESGMGEASDNELAQAHYRVARSARS
jgi:DNA invertase Pin-like site-specific DNA recombinase